MQFRRAFRTDGACNAQPRTLEHASAGSPQPTSPYRRAQFRSPKPRAIAMRPSVRRPSRDDAGDRHRDGGVGSDLHRAMRGPSRASGAVQFALDLGQCRRQGRARCEFPGGGGYLSQCDPGPEDRFGEHFDHSGHLGQCSDPRVPDNPDFNYDPAGWPNAPALPPSIANAVNDVDSNSQINAMKPTFGATNVYGNAYTLLPGQSDTVGNPPPYQVSSAIFSQSVHAGQLVSSRLPEPTDAGPLRGELGAGKFADRRFPQRAYNGEHDRRADLRDPGAGLLSAAGSGGGGLRLCSERERRALSARRDRRAEFSARTWSPRRSPANRPMPARRSRRPICRRSAARCRLISAAAAVRHSRRHAPPASRHASPKATSRPPLSTARRAQDYIKFLTYGFPSVGPTDLAPVVPADAHVLIATRFPYLSEAQLNDDPRLHRIAFGRADRQRLRLGAAQSLRRLRRLWRVRQ